MPDPLHELLIEHLAPLGRITIRRMFGGAGVYCDGVIVALIADDALYLKVDDANRPDFEAEGMAPFSYDTKTGRTTITSYWRMPERLFDEADELVAWARKALQASLRAGSAKAQPKPRTRAAGNASRSTAKPAARGAAAKAPGPRPSGRGLPRRGG